VHRTLQVVSDMCGVQRNASDMSMDVAAAPAEATAIALRAAACAAARAALSVVWEKGGGGGLRVDVTCDMRTRARGGG